MSYFNVELKKLPYYMVVEEGDPLSIDPVFLQEYMSLVMSVEAMTEIIKKAKEYQDNLPDNVIPFPGKRS